MQIAYTVFSQGGTGLDIYLYDLASKTSENLIASTARGQAHSCPAWSPDGSLLAWSYSHQVPHENELRIMNTETGVVKQITARGFDHPPVWSPDSKKIAYRETNSTINILNLDDMNIHVLQSTKRFQGEELAWSPHSTHIACVLLRDDFYQLAIIAVDDDRAIFPLEKGYHIEEIRWLDNQTLRAIVESDEIGSYYRNLCSISIDGEVSPLLELDPIEYTLAKLSPNGTKIAYFTYIPIPINEVSVYRGGLGDLYVINDDGSNRRHLLHRVTSAPLIVWSNDEKWLACDPNFDSPLYAVSIEDGQHQFIGERCSEPAWRPSPD
jgi:Tol biopolymer transport system component